MTYTLELLTPCCFLCWPQPEQKRLQDHNLAPHLCAPTSQAESVAGLRSAGAGQSSGIQGACSGGDYAQTAPGRQA